MGQQKERAGKGPGLQAPTRSPPTHYVAVVSLSHEQHAANEVGSGDTLGAFAFPAGTQTKDKAEATRAYASLPSHHTSVTPGQYKTGAISSILPSTCSQYQVQYSPAELLHLHTTATALVRTYLAETPPSRANSVSEA